MGSISRETIFARTDLGRSRADVRGRRMKWVLVQGGTFLHGSAPAPRKGAPGCIGSRLRRVGATGHDGAADGRYGCASSGALTPW
ncbi:hypothetical protein GCM10022233_67400 [Streptomyces shaanxiensis]|uniref:Uncharacterized protein n=1 Tax=Streptomyces shaanxiensis TaxID=653357 RepID=A0ABP7W0W6_9ACTN